MVKIIQTHEAPAPVGPYSQGIMVGYTLYVSGQIPIQPATGRMSDESIEAETHQVMKNLSAILKQAEVGFDQVVKCSIFITNMDDFARINEVYASYFTATHPARETVEVSRLPKGARVEISCIAHKE